MFYLSAVRDIMVVHAVVRVTYVTSFQVHS